MSGVQELIRQAIHTDDADAMQSALEQLFGSGAGGVSAEDEYEMRHEDYVMEMPQRMLRDTRYYAKQLDPPPWRAEFTDPG
jgi:hypothetical protein